MRLQKKERNEKLIKLRLEDADKWTFDKLGKEFNIKRQTAHDLFFRHIDNYNKNKLSTRKADKVLTNTDK